MKVLLQILLISVFAANISLNAQDVEEYKKDYRALSKDQKIQSLFQICDYYLYEEADKDSLRLYSEELSSLMEGEKYNVDRLKAEMFYCLSVTAFDEDYLERINSVVSKAEELQSFPVLAELYSKLAFINLSKGDFRDAIKNGNLANDALTKAGVKQVKGGESLKSHIIGNLSVSYRKNADLPTALEYAIQNERLTDSLGISKLQYSAITKFIGIYGDLASEEKMYGTKEERAKYQKLLETYLLKAYDFSKADSNKRNQAVSAFNMSIFYALDSNLTASLSYVDTAIMLSKEIGHKGILTEAYSIKADNLSDLHQRDSAIYYETMALEGARELGNTNLEVTIGLDMAAHNIVYKNYGEARKYLDEAYSLAEKEKLYPKIKRAHFQYYEIARKNNEPAEALEHYVRYIDLRDSIVNEETQANLAELTSKYQTELKEKEIEVLKNEKDVKNLIIKRKNNLILFGLLFTLGLCAFLFFYFKAKNEIERQKALNAKQKLLRSQLNPHFLFNALNSIQQFIYQKADPTKIADYLAKFSRLTRRILINSKEDLITLEEEIEFLKDYMDLQQIRFDKPFNYNITIDDDLDTEEITIPPMFTQPFIENSIEHGILNKKDAGEISIVFKKNGEELEVNIEDNGIGIEKSIFLKKNQKHRSMATEITRERITMIEKKLRKKASLVIKDRTRKDDLVTGTSVVLKLPIIYA